MQNVLKGVYSIEGDNWKNISDEGRDLVRKMLEYDPRKRLSARDALDNVWFELIANKEKVD
jgi:serine/threonine protein kinase